MIKKHQENYLRTDLAEECRAREGEGFEGIDGITFSEERLDFITVSRLIISTEQASDIIGKPIGSYVTVGFIPPTLMTDEQTKALENTLSGVIREFIFHLCPNCSSVLTVGLGNTDITADSIGPRCVSDITVTRHLKSHMPELYQKLCHLETSAMVPGVLGQTGFESAVLIRSAAEEAKPDLVLVIDALAARSPERLLCTVQLCDSGISPGSGVKNSRPAINKEYLNTPVIAIGVPTVVETTAIILDVMERCMENPDHSLMDAILKDNQKLFVSPKEIDQSVKVLCPIISGAINSALSK